MAFTSDNVAVFLAVLDHGSFSAAARALGKVPSAVSMAIAQLEAELDLPLFDRIGREPRPTNAARSLEPRARQLASQLRQLDAHALALHAGLERRLTIAIAPDLMAAPWSAPLAVLADEYPALEVDVLTVPQADALRMLHAGDVHLALVYERERVDEREAFEEVASELLVVALAAGHPQAAAGVLRLEDLLDMRQIVVASRDGSRDPRYVISRQVWRTDSQQATLSLVQAGLGWAYLPRALVQPLMAAGTLVEIDFDNISNKLRLWVDMVWSRERPLGLGARRYIELMREGRNREK
ncbi:LysR family transcriptional regulator [Pseudoduganella ginsengisoli]|uniref:LysR family transcriptional regulator n=1 Tax=Pseudoduganella ginsengisoli TaxID=1462440 RepID=A0A6L6PVG4_9BURK|nr:LysR family transcriptional regulator [Pseudoduganella ginsengisoli]MTW01487.1 LysR family transcriptional regulator [Pseudoduganella ginsengisoli]